MLADATNDDNMKEAAADCLEENAEQLIKSLKNNVNNQDLMSQLYLRLANKLKSLKNN